MLAATDGGAALALIVALYFLPSIVASSRKHHQTGAIIVLNLLLGWTVLGWILAMVWAATAVKTQPAQPLGGIMGAIQRRATEHEDRQRREQWANLKSDAPVTLARAQARLASLDDGVVPRKHAGVNGVLAAIAGFAVAMLLLILADLYFNAGGNVQFVLDKLQPTAPKMADKLKPETAIQSLVVEHGVLPPKKPIAKAKKPAQN
jgi:Superinfection immunity protein